MFTNHDKIRLRWRFDFATKNSRFGQWSRAADREEDTAWRSNGEGLVRASIEAQDIVTSEIFSVAECDGHDFCNFQWVYSQSVGTGHVKIVGLTLLTRNQRLCVFVDGSIKFEDRPEEDKTYHYATYGR